MIRPPSTAYHLGAVTTDPDTSRPPVGLLRLVHGAERWQVPLYLGAVVLGALVGLLVTDDANGIDRAITPSLILLLYTTFLAVPFTRIRSAAGDRRFMAAILLLNFAVVPLVVLGLSRFVASDEALLVGVLLVLLTPCIDYVIAFTRIAGGDAPRLLAATPLLMLVQILLLPVLLIAFAGGDVVDVIDWTPFAQAFVLLIAVPLGLSLLTQNAARRAAPARRVVTVMDGLMVPLMMITLFVITASQINEVTDHADRLVTVIPLYVVFLAVMPVLGGLVGRLARQETPGRRALAFSGATRNSLVVLPLALALPDALSLAAAVVVTQTLVELAGMVVLTRVVPRMIR